MGQKHKSAICDMTPPHLHIKPSLYVCRRVQGSQIFKQNSIISICSRVIWMGVGVVRGCPPHTCTCMHTHACTHMHAHVRTRMCGKHDNFMQMAASIGFLGNPWEFPMMSYVCMRACMCMHVCVCGGHPSPPPTHIHPPPPPGGTP